VSTHGKSELMRRNGENVKLKAQKNANKENEAMKRPK